MASIPEGFHTITPQIAVSNGDKAIAHYAEALGAKELRRTEVPGSRLILHAVLQIGDSKVFLHDVEVQRKKPKGVGSSFYIYVTDVDEAHKRALSAGMSEVMAPQDMFWGDRFSAVDDRYGHRWCFAAHAREVSREELARVVEQQFREAGGGEKKDKSKARDRKAKKDKKDTRKKDKKDKKDKKEKGKDRKK